MEDWACAAVRCWEELSKVAGSRQGAGSAVNKCGLYGYLQGHPGVWLCLCLSLFGTAQLGALFCVRRVFLTDDIAHKQNKICLMLLMLKLPPAITITLEQMHVFQASAIAKRTVSAIIRFQSFHLSPFPLRRQTPCQVFHCDLLWNTCSEWHQAGPGMASQGSTKPVFCHCGLSEFKAHRV